MRSCRKKINFDMTNHSGTPCIKACTCMRKFIFYLLPENKTLHIIANYSFFSSFLLKEHFETIWTKSDKRWFLTHSHRVHYWTGGLNFVISGYTSKTKCRTWVKLYICWELFVVRKTVVLFSPSTNNGNLTPFFMQIAHTYSSWI